MALIISLKLDYETEDIIAFREVMGFDKFLS